MRRGGGAGWLNLTFEKLLWREEEGMTFLPEARVGGGGEQRDCFLRPSRGPSPLGNIPRNSLCLWPRSHLCRVGLCVHPQRAHPRERWGERLRVSRWREGSVLSRKNLVYLLVTPLMADPPSPHIFPFPREGLLFFTSWDGCPTTWKNTCGRTWLQIADLDAFKGLSSPVWLAVWNITRIYSGQK